MPRAPVEVVGLNRLRRKIAQMPEAWRRAIRFELKVAGVNTEAEAKRRAPVDTGRLRNSITHEEREDGFVVVVGTNVQYAPFQEWGTRRMPAQPFLFPAFEAERRQFAARLKRALDKVGKDKAAVR